LDNPEATVNEPARDLNMEVFSAKPEPIESEPVNALTRPLTSEATRPREPERDLNREALSTKPEA
jgi:hypothetical protein